MKLRLLFLAACVLAATSIYAADKKVSLEGTLVSSVCYLANGQTGNDMGGNKTCGSDCLKHGDPAGLLTTEKQFHILVAPSIRLAPYAGQLVRISGTDYDGAIVVEKAEVRKDASWEEIDLKLAK
jgi:hypothetical protein